MGFVACETFLSHECKVGRIMWTEPGFSRQFLLVKMSVLRRSVYDQLQGCVNVSERSSEKMPVLGRTELAHG